MQVQTADQLVDISSVRLDLAMEARATRNRLQVLEQQATILLPAGATWTRTRFPRI